MNFNSLAFIIFLIVVVFLYWIIPHKYRYILLLIASYIFYMCWNYKLIILIVSTTLLTYISGLLIEKTNNKKIKKLYLIITLSFCLGLLIYFKYFNFLYNGFINLLNIFNLNLSNQFFNIILPVGISFYTFQTLSYVIDIYKGKYEAEKNIGYYALFVSFFPQLVAGPIERPNDLIPQLKSEKKIEIDNFIIGFKFILIGYIRKCLIADLCGIYVDNVFLNLSDKSSISIIIGAFLFLIQIYNDFAGYSEIALGSAKLLGIDLSINFNFPLVSKSYTEFFRRWHITLNSWFTDYLYIPLGGNKKGKFRKVFNTMIVFILCGLWHGASYTYLLWGAVAGVMVSLESLLRKPVLKLFNRFNIDINNKYISILRHIIMILLFSLSSILFRATSLNDIALAYKNIFTNITFDFNKIAIDLSLKNYDFIYIIITLIIMSLLPILYNDNFIKEIKSFNLNYVALIVFTVLLITFSWLHILSLTDSSSFQYFQF